MRVRFANRRLQRGAAAVEFGLVLVPFLLLVFGIIQYGVLFWSFQGGSDVARDAARRAAVSDPAICGTASGFVAVTRTEVGNLRDASDIPQVTRIYDNASGGDPSVVEVGDNATVTLSFRSPNFHLPFVPLPHDARVTTHATARVEYVSATPPVNCP